MVDLRVGRGRKRGWVRAAMSAMACAAFAGAAAGDVISMADGRLFVGRIVKETPTHVSLDTIVHGVRATIELQRAHIENIILDPLPDDFFEPEAPKEEAGGAGAPEEVLPELPDEPAGAARYEYIVAPIEGVFGEDILADGVESALKAAKRARIRHIVFVIDSDGGRVDEANDILALLREHDADFTYTAYVRRAISASIWVVFACDKVFVAPGASIGGAVAYSRERTTGAAKVDAKMNSILASDIALMAETRGHDPAMVRAMMEPEREYHCWLDKSGERKSDVRAPAPADRSETIVSDGARTVLTLTAPESVATGLAREAPETVEGLGPLLGEASWRVAGDVGQSAMRRAQAQEDRKGRERDRIIGRMKQSLERLDALVAAAESADPAQGHYYYDRQSGLFTPQSQIDWRRRSDEAIAAWGAVEQALQTALMLEGRAERAGFTTGLDRAAIESSLSSVQVRIHNLEEGRRRNRP